MVIDVHVHIAAAVAGHGRMSRRLLSMPSFRFMAFHFDIHGATAESEQRLRRQVVRTINATPELDAAVVLAFDAVYTPDGRRHDARTHLYVANDYVIDLARQHRKVLFGASVHPYRPDAIAELERCMAAGAVLCKWLPVTQDMDPADARCIPFYEALAHHKLPLLCHTGAEGSLPTINMSLADPTRLREALRRGVTVILAHCGTRDFSGEGSNYLPQFLAMVREHEHCYGDTAALNLPHRWAAYEPVLADPLVRNKMVHGSDWPIMPIANPRLLGWGPALRLMLEGNWMRRDIAIKRTLGFDDDYWHRAGKILRMAGR